MSVIIILIIFSVLVASAFLAAFIWAVRSGQFDDTTSPAVRILNDEKKIKEPDQTADKNPMNQGESIRGQETSTKYQAPNTKLQAPITKRQNQSP